MGIKDRISYLIKINQLTASSFAQKIGVQPSSISHIISGRNKPSLDVIQKILNGFPKVDASWLINGERSKSTPTVQETIKHDATPMSNKSIVTASSESSGERKLLKVILFYSDQTIEEFNHS